MELSGMKLEYDGICKLFIYDHHLYYYAEAFAFMWMSLYK